MPSELAWPAYLTLAVVVVMVLALARTWVAPVVAVLGANIVLLLSGVITTEQALSGFSNPAPITVAALFVLARAVEKTGALQPLLRATLENGGSGAPGGGSPRVALLRLLIPTAGASAFLNNTPIVAMLAPQVKAWAEKRGQAASWYLIPLSFATILGGMLTLMGTSTNLVVSGLMQQSGQAPLGVFEITRLGLPVAAVGLVLLVFFSTRLLPDRRSARQQFEQDYREFVVHMHVAPGGAIAGQTVEQAGLRSLQGVFLAEVVRGDGEAIAPAAPATRLEPGDRLVFVGRADVIRDLHATPGLVPVERQHAEAFHDDGHTFFEAVVSATSPLAGRTLKEADFRGRYQAAVLAIHRAGSRVKAKLGEVRLKEGDTLLLVADEKFGQRWRHRSDFLLVSHLGGTPPVASRKGWLVGAVMLGVVGLAGLGLVPMLQAALAGALLLVLCGVLSPWEAKRSVELDVLLIIAAAFGIGAAIQSSGLATALGGVIVEHVAAWGPLAVLLAVVLATSLLTELITNNAAAVLMFPVGMAASAAIGADPRPFAIGIAIAASASFLTPIGYQTNTMVYGMGGYRFGDFARVGFPLTLLMLLTIALFVPYFWPMF
jgi:di/tricarboxylate transporter